LGGRPSLAGYEDLFDSGTYRDLAVAEQPAGGQRLLSCVEESETEIRNNTCVLGKFFLIIEKEIELTRITCSIAPEVTEGPYYHTVGHPIRQNIAEFQFGLLTVCPPSSLPFSSNISLTPFIPQLLDIGVIDVETCQPLPNVLVDIWHANATGHYAGHPDPAPHLVDEKPAAEGPRRGLRTAYPRTNTEETWLRGAWATDARGVAQFSSEFFGALICIKNSADGLTI
jgi:protocatechuate 3,4-dioxygenase beta subunit